MIKLEVTERFTLQRFDELKDIERIGTATYGQLFVGDKFWCEKELADYLMGNNKLNKSFVKVIEIMPEKEVKEEKLEKPKKKKKSTK